MRFRTVIELTFSMLFMSQNYSHRIGRTGRAGKVGLATSLITDADEGIMAPLKKYLESTGNAVPDRLAKHPAAQSAVLNNLID